MTSRKGWSIDSKQWDELGKIGKRYNLVWKKAPYNKESLMMIPEAPGVYMLCADVPNVDLRKTGLGVFSSPLYIGRTWQSGGLRARLRSHLVNPQDSVKDVYHLTTHLYITYSTCKFDNKHIGLLEDRLINAFGPPANRVKASILGRLGKTERVIIFEE